VPPLASLERRLAFGIESHDLGIARLRKFETGGAVALLMQDDEPALDERFEFPAALVEFFVGEYGHRVGLDQVGK